ncbi:MAG: B12-binding domain-containing protein [Nitrososphaera sp.]|uniref:B12-binding domain-containing protein n=1 Tax=Nitrososphaera sp. TaxID=1971748 RepID=UPI001824331B|nr:B12-binding domain-containing protein [Nitrososphaera sp.]NWG36280.1 B12-binding domain-containing protein [Nitrososphaera sp.]
MYRRYTLDEVKRKIVDALQNAGTGLSGIELADKTGLNRMTITKYLDVMHAIGLVKKKKVGTVNVWFLETGVADIEFPVNYNQVQQKMLDFALAGEEEQARRLLVSVLNSNVDQVKVLTDVILPAAKTVSELYSRGRIGKTERIHLSEVLAELVDLVKFNARPAEPKMNAHVICVAGTDDMVHLAKSAAVAFQVLGWDSQYVGSIEQDMDPFFDIDFQRYLSRVWGNRRGLLLVCILSSGEGPMRLLASTTRSMKGRLKGELRLAIVATPELQQAGEEGADLVVTDLQQVIDWAERQYVSVAS